MVNAQLPTWSDCQTPKDFTPEYDWRKERWVRDVSDLSAHIGLCVAAALQAEPRNPNPTDQDREDAIVYALLRPDLMERAWGSHNEIARDRVAHAISQAIEMITLAWAKDGRK